MLSLPPRAPTLLAFLLLVFWAVPGRADDLDNLLKKLPATDRATGEAVCKDLVKGGKETVEKLVALLDGKQDARARYALHGLAVYTSRPKADKERAEFATALAAQVDGKHSAAIKAFLLQQLLYCGGPEVVAGVARHLSDETLADPAASVLVRVGGDKASAALRDGLDGAKPKARVAIVQALGKLRDRKALEAILELAKDKDRDTRLASLDALAQIGDDSDATRAAFLAGVPEARSLEHGRAIDACLVYADRLKEQAKEKSVKAFLGKLKDAVKDDKSKAQIDRYETKLLGKQGDEK